MQNEQYSTMEVVIFKAKAQYNDEQVAEALSSINPILQKYEGFISRQISKNGDGLWMDLVYWKNLEMAHEAANQVMKEAAAMRAFAVIDEESMRMYHFIPVQPSFARQEET